MTAPDPITPSELYAAAAIIAAEADERGMRHWTALANRLCVEASLRAVESEGRDE